MDNLKIYTDFLISPLGTIKIQATSHEIIKVIFDSKKTNSLNNSLTKECQKQLTEYFMGKRKVFDIPFSFKGTNFQEAIWSAITKIDFGATTSYKNIAAMVRNPAAIRATGNALNKNPIAIIIPCHRIVRKDGQMTNFAGGTEKKSWLLSHENNYKTKTY